MKKLTTLFAIIAIASTGAFAQQGDRLKEKDLLGEWYLVFDTDALEEEVDQELDGEHWLAEAIAASATSFAFEILDNIDIQMEFYPHNELKIIVDAYGEHEIESGRWWIEDDALYIESDDDHDSVDSDYWIYRNGKLIAFDSKWGADEMQPVYMIRN